MSDNEGCCEPCVAFCGYLKKNKIKKSNQEAGSSDPEAVLIFENAIIKTVDLIIEYLSWATAGILSIACYTTILIAEKDNLVGSWINFFVLLSLSLLYGSYIVSYFVDNYKIVGNNLKVQFMNKTNKSDGSGDMTIAQHVELQLDHNTDYVNREQEKQANEAKEQDAVEAGAVAGAVAGTHIGHIHKPSKAEFMKFARLTHMEFNILFKNMNTLAIATFANVVALTLNNTITDTINAIFNTDNNNNDIGFAILLYWIIAISATLLTICFSFKLTEMYVKCELNAYNAIEKFGINESSKKVILAYASRRRMIRLICYVFGMCAGWTWNDAIKYSIYAIFDERTNAGVVTILFIHVLLVQLIVTLFNTLARQMRGLKQSHFGKYFNFNQIGQKSYKNKSWLAYAVFYKNIQVVAGLAWYEFVSGTIFAVSGKSEATTIGLLWLQIFVLMILSVTLQYYFKKYWFGYKILQQGLLRAYYDTCDYVTGNEKQIFVNEEQDNNNNHEDIADTDAILSTPRNLKSTTSKFWFIFWKEFVELLIYSWNVAGGVSVYTVLTFTFMVLFYKSQKYSHIDGTTQSVNVTTVIVIWVSWLVLLFVAVLVLTYLTSIIKKATNKRKELFRKWNQNRLSLTQAKKSSGGQPADTATT